MDDTRMITVKRTHMLGNNLLKLNIDSFDGELSDGNARVQFYGFNRSEMLEMTIKLLGQRRK